MAEEKEMIGESPDDLRKLFSWVKSVESKVIILRRELEVIKNDSARRMRELDTEMRSAASEVTGLKRELAKTNEQLALVIKELRLTAGKDELMTVKKYLELWNPIKFTSKEEVGRMIEDRVEELK
ncbi:MAG TPA: hypothetical protein VJG31_03300 [Candidatus Nanoarchaeia archaeon]|nr:hypothetical protein [Candidatus Nanoarchaeia archaeon]